MKLLLLVIALAAILCFATTIGGQQRANAERECTSWDMDTGECNGWAMSDDNDNNNLPDDSDQSDYYNDYYKTHSHDGVDDSE